MAAHQVALNRRRAEEALGDVQLLVGLHVGLHVDGERSRAPDEGSEPAVGLEADGDRWRRA
jgi:hypothetical protein